MLDIRFAKTIDANKIMEFIHCHWKENHILSRDKDFFLYEYKDNDMINFVIAIDDKSNVYGILGFIKSSNSNSDIWTSMWKSIKHYQHPMLGLELLEFLRNSNKLSKVTSIGINTDTIPIYHYLGIYTNNLNQYIIINKNIHSFNILEVEDIKSIKKMIFLENSQYSLIKLKKCELDFDFDSQDYIPHKNKKYFIKRYYNHPIYNYTVYGVYTKKSLTSLIVTREVIVNDSKILRIMDFIGNEVDILYVSKYLYKIVVNNNYEYIDFMCFGFNDDNLEDACFTKINIESNSLIAPNYFSPLIKENININFMADTKELDKIRFCKADGDQDRPS